MVYCSPLSNLDSYFCPNKSNGQWNEQKEPKRRWMKKADHWISEVECRMECRMEWNAGESQRTISTTISTGTEWATHMVSNNNQTKHQLINKSYIPPTGTENTDAVCHYKKKICCLTTRPNNNNKHTHNKNKPTLTTPPPPSKTNNNNKSTEIKCKSDILPRWCLEVRMPPCVMVHS